MVGRKYLKQEKYYPSLDPKNKAVLSVVSGETFVVVTEDAASGKIRTQQDLLSSIKFEDLNPVSGPIYVEGAQKGDTLAVHINDIQIPDIGWSGFTPEWDQPYWNTRRMGVQPPSVTRICKIRNGIIFYPLSDGSEIQIEARPFIGTIGTAPEVEGVLSMGGGKHGGNLDFADVCKGNSLFLPVFVEGALLHLGDVHAVQGDGELNGGPVEVAAECILTVDVLKGKKIHWPRIETPGSLITLGLANPLDDALRLASEEMVLWLHEDYGVDIWDASLLQVVVANARVGGGFNFNAVMAVEFPKRYLSKRI